MRFYVPNMEDQEKEEGEVKGDKEMKDGKEASDEDEEEEITPAKVFNDLILKKAGLGDAVGDIIASFHDLPL